MNYYFLKQDPEYQERMLKLRQQLDEDEYQRMVANVDLNSRYRKNNDNKVSLFPECKKHIIIKI